MDFLSNMYSCEIHYDGEVFPCVETAFQHAKTDEQEKFLNDRGYWVNGHTARKIGQSVKVSPNWENDKLSIMYELLEDKFLHNEKLRQALKDTGNIYLQEESDDPFWGVCNGKGMNMLGRMLMEIRQTIQDSDRKTMRVIVAGGRDFNDYDGLCKKLDYYFANINPIVICGEARGADALGKRYATEHGYPVESYPADWSQGKGAGFLRNIEMSKVADAAVCFWDGQSKGTKHMIDIMTELDKPVKIVKYCIK